jgi:hypothetical protein
METALFAKKEREREREKKGRFGKPQIIAGDVEKDR